MAYYSKGTNVANLAGAAGIANAGISSLFQGMNIMTDLDLPNEGFSDGVHVALDGYKWNGALIYYINVSLINSLRKNINITSKTEMATGRYELEMRFYNTLTYPKIYFVGFQAEGGRGSSGRSTFGCGGGSGFYSFHKVVVLPGSSFSVTHRAFSALFQPHVGSSVYFDGRYVSTGYAALINAASGEDATEDDPGVGFRNGGYPEQENESTPQLAEGGGIAANALLHDGYTCPAYAIYGGQGGKARASSMGMTARAGGGGGGASAAHYLRTGAAERTGGSGGFSSDQGSRYPENGSFGGGGGGGDGDGTGGAASGARGGDAYTIVFH